ITRTKPRSAPTSGRVNRVTATTTAPAMPTITTHLKTAASLSFTTPETPRRRFAAASEDVDGDEHDDPHDVDEVPVDPWHLDPEMILRVGPEVAAEGTDRREREQHQTGEDVGSVEAGEAVEDRAEPEVPGAEAEVDVLVELDEEEGRTEEPGRDQAQLHAGAVAVADRLEGVMDREARGDEDHGVHPGDRNRQLEGLWRPARRVDDDPEEEVGGEEGTEQHHLGNDEEQDPQRLAIDAGAGVGLGRAVMVVGVLVTDSYGCALHQLASPPATAAATAAAGRPTSMCSTDLSVISRTRPIRSSSSHCERSPVKVEMRMSSIR